MNFFGKNLTLGAAAVAVALLLAPGAGMSTTLGGATAAQLAPQAGVAADAGTVILAKDKGPGDFKCCGKGGGGGIPPGPGDFKGGGKGGGNHHHHHGWGAGAAIGGAIILGMGYCATRSASCEEEYGDGTGRYWRCMRRAGCAD
jgi:hypothetical protein